jgi:hypothetical protein
MNRIPLVAEALPPNWLWRRVTYENAKYINMIERITERSSITRSPQWYRENTSYSWYGEISGAYPLKERG